MNQISSFELGAGLMYLWVELREVFLEIKFLRGSLAGHFSRIYIYSLIIAGIIGEIPEFV